MQSINILMAIRLFTERHKEAFSEGEGIFRKQQSDLLYHKRYGLFAEKTDIFDHEAMGFVYLQF